jgi:hypothetical protein
MVLVSYILENSASILQTKFRNREGHEARRIGLEPMPLDQHIETDLPLKKALEFPILSNISTSCMDLV